MPTRRSGQGNGEIKEEPAVSSSRVAEAPNSTAPSATLAGIPATPTVTRPVTPSDHHHRGRSGTASFYRSDAPSAETHNRLRDQEQTPLFMETRYRRVGSQVGSPTAQDGSFGQGSFAHPAFADIGMKLKACNDTLGNLQALGIQHVARLPELVLVGDQSAGKSSLMSGLAHLDLPRSGGVCTRCPVHIRMSSSNSPGWSCTVSLQQDYDYVPSGRIRKSDVTQKNPFPPWVKKPTRETKTFKTIYEQRDIETVLRWAQVAILNPQRSHELYIPGEGVITKDTDLTTAAAEAEAQFSPNIVALEMKGADLPDLSFYDLPGVFVSPEKEDDEYIVKVVENLTRSFIKRSQAIIMWALPMNLDLENNICLRVIRESKATDRTIGVITKADMLQSSNIPQWLAVLEGRKQSVKHGYFLTSLPPDETVANAATWESSFFRAGVASWPHEFAKYENRCGVEQLREYITKQLGRAFSQSLPEIKATLATRLKEVEAQLQRLPELPENVELEVRMCLNEFLTDVRATIKDPRFTSKWSLLNSQFQTCINRMKPSCIVRDKNPTPIDVESEAESSTPKRPRASDSTVRATPTKRVRTDAQQPLTLVKSEDSSGSHPNQQPSASEAAAPAQQEKSPFAKYQHLGRQALDIKDIRREILSKKRPGMPPHLVPSEVYECLTMAAIRKWEKPLDTYMDKTMELLDEAINESLQKSLSKLQQRLIFKKSREHMKHFLAESGRRQRDRLADRFGDEVYGMFTLNTEAFQRFKADELKLLQRTRNWARLKAAALVDWAQTMPVLEKMSSEDHKKEAQLMAAHLPKIGEDSFQTEIEVAATVRGYYLTAASYFVEGVTKETNARLFRAFRDQGLNMFLDEKLGLHPYPTPGVYQHLMEEDEQTARERDQLKKEMAKLKQARASIVELESSSSASSGGGGGGAADEMDFQYRPRHHTVDDEDDYDGADNDATVGGEDDEMMMEDTA